MAQQNDEGSNAADEVQDETVAAADTMASEVENVEDKVGDAAGRAAETVANNLNPGNW